VPFGYRFLLRIFVQFLSQFYTISVLYFFARPFCGAKQIVFECNGVSHQTSAKISSCYWPEKLFFDNNDIIQPKKTKIYKKSTKPYKKQNTKLQNGTDDNHFLFQIFLMSLYFLYSENIHAPASQNLFTSTWKQQKKKRYSFSIHFLTTKHAITGCFHRENALCADVG